MKGREIIFFPFSTSRLSSRAVIFTSTRVYCSLIIPEVNEGPKLTIYTLFVFFAYLSVFFVSASSLLKQAINAFWSVKEATQEENSSFTNSSRTYDLLATIIQSRDSVICWISHYSADEY